MSHTGMRSPTKIRNFCRSCRQDFSSVKGFDRHRVGTHEYDWDLDHEDGRRCLDIEEIVLLGFKRDKHGRWYDPAQSPAARLRPRQKLTEAS